MDILNQSQISTPRNIYELQTYTPGSDIAVGFNQSQVVWGRTGNNTLLGYQPLTKNTGQLQIDTLIGGIEIVDLKDPLPRQPSNTFILGDWSKPYYANGDPSIFGLNDFALIVDFNPAQDIIQLNGTPKDYELVKTPLGSTLLWNQKNVPDAISFFIGNSDLSLEGKYFSFKGYTPPSGPVQGQIQQLGTEGFDLTPTIATDPFGNVYVAGGTSGSFGGANVSDSRDALVAKYDSTGNPLWVKQFGSSSFDTIYGIATDNQGNFYVAGTTQGNLGAIKQAANSDAWVAKYDSDGNQLWIKQFGSAGDDQTFRLNIDNDDNIFLTGYTNGNLGGTNAGSFDAWVSRFDTDGNQVWIQQYGTPEFDQGYGISTDNAGNLYATGITQGSFGGTNAGSFDGWVAKIDKTSGNLQNFNGTPQSVNAFPSLNLLASNAGSPQITGQQIDYLTNFFEEFLSSIGIGRDGSGLENLIRNPYVMEPTPVPEASSGIGLLMFAAVSCVGAMLRGRKISPSKSRISIE